MNLGCTFAISVNLVRNRKLKSEQRSEIIFSLFSNRISHAKQFHSKISKIGQILKKLFNKRTLMKPKKNNFCNNFNFLIKKCLIMVFGIYT